MLSARTVRDLVLDLWASAQVKTKTILLVTHSIEEAVFLSDRIIVMTPRPGRIAEILVNELSRPRTVETYEEPLFAEYCGTIRRIILEADSRVS